MLLKAKLIKQKVKEAGKSINPGAIVILDRHIDEIITAVIQKQAGRRITEKTIQL